MKLKNLFVVFCLLMFVCFSANSQVKKKSNQKKVTRTIIDRNNISPMPEIKDFAFVVEIDKDANIILRIQNSEDSEYLSNKSLTDFFSEFSRVQNTKIPNKTQNLLDPIIIIKADSSLKYGDIIKVIQSSRISYTQKIYLQISQGLYVVVPPRIEDTVILKPNPNFLLVNLRKDSKIQLNQEDVGDFENTSPLREILVKIFKDRYNFGVLREGTNEVEKTVVVKAPLSVKFSDVIRLIQSVAETGASPIGLQVDDLEE